jgi:xylitol oxidase
VDELCEWVRTRASVKALGTRHSFNDIADSAGTLVSTAKLTGISPVDTQNGTVTVEAGVTYGMLCRELDRQGYAVHNMASLPHITVAGACATATHGSGEKNGNLATSVSRIEIVKADGSMVEFTRAANPDVFPGLVVGLGAIGIVSRITLEVEPAFEVSQQVYREIPLETALAHFDEIQRTGYSVSLFTEWKRSSINQIWIKCRTDAAQSPGTDLFGAPAAAIKLHPIEALDAEPCTEQMGIAGRWYERLPHFKLEFTPSAAIELQSEYFVPREHAAAALLAINSLSPAIVPLLQVSEIRTIAADDLWLSPCYKRDSVSIHFTWFQKQAEVESLLPQIERALAPYRARPHWGKLFNMKSPELASLYPRCSDFQMLVNEFDPQGKFWNAYLERCVGAMKGH